MRDLEQYENHVVNIQDFMRLASRSRACLHRYSSRDAAFFPPHTYGKAGKFLYTFGDVHRYLRVICRDKKALEIRVNAYLAELAEGAE